MTLRNRISTLERQQGQPDEVPGPGLATLLAFAKKHQCVGAAASDDDEGVEGDEGDGLRRLLREAKEWKEHQS